MSNKKYIDVDLLKSELQDLNESERLYYMGVFDIINSQPIVDAKKVQHGKWINHSGGEWGVLLVLISYSQKALGKHPMTTTARIAAQKWIKNRSDNNG